MSEDRYWTADIPNPDLGGTFDRYTTTDFIRATRFSIVYGGFDTETGEKVVMKFVKRLRGHETLIENEIELQRSVSYPGVVEILADFSYHQFHVIVMPFAPFGSLEEFQTKKYPCGMPESMVQSIASQILNVISVLHGQEIIHCDIKLDNFLVFDDNILKPVVKLSDFGLARHLREGEHLTEVNGTRQYFAPEMWLRKEYIWAFGVMVFKMLCGQMPFTLKGNTVAAKKAHLRALKNGAIEFRKSQWIDISTDAADFVKRILNPDPTKRPSPGDALDDQWLGCESKATPIESEIADAMQAPLDIPDFVRE